MVAAAGFSVASPFWLTAWALGLALAWLVPNHFPPWPSFHMDAWAGFMAALGAVSLWVRDRSPSRVPASACVVAALALLPGLQFALGLIPFAGQAWMPSIYLLGLACAIGTGYRWERATPGQLPNALFLSIALAGVVSVWLQLSTWLDLWRGGFMEVWWSMSFSGERPYANLGQPNLLATLLIWGLLACLWFHVRGKLGAGTAILVAVWLLIGIALTQSRMATLALATGLVAIFLWRRLWPSSRLPWVCLGLFVFLLLCPPVLGWLQVLLDVGPERDFQRLSAMSAVQDARVAAWHTFALAALQRPWTGYGWTELVHAQLAVAGQLPALHAAFGHTHNLFLDLATWNGLPVGLAILLAILCWLWRSVRSVRCAQDAVLLMLLGGIGIHAMLELPLQYAHFLLPVGMVVGVLDARRGARVRVTGPWWVWVVPLLTAAALLGLVVRDYLRVEQSYTALRFEEKRIGSAHLNPGKPPDVVLLTHMREWFRFARFEMQPRMHDEDMASFMDVAKAFPTTSAFFRVGTMLALNGRPEEAAQWLGKICPLIDALECASIEAVWKARAKADVPLQAVPWPAP